MLQVVPKWRVQVTFGPSREPVTIWVSDMHLANVLRTVASIDFTNGPEQPTAVRVELA